MSPSMLVPVALGFRVKSGRAIAVLLSGPISDPELLDRREVALADPRVPECCQPYHAALVPHARRGEAEAARLVRWVKRFASRSVQGLLDAYAAQGQRPRRAGIVVGSVTDPRTIANPHIRAHAQEGRLFCVVLEEAARAGGVRPTVVLEKELLERASRRLAIPQRRLRTRVVALARGKPGQWRAEEKAAALAAWMALAGP